LVVLHLIGQSLIRTAVARITPRADLCFALASYLARERGKRVPRRVIERILWPVMPPLDAAHSLSELIHKLRTKGVAIARDDASCIWLPRESTILDIDTIAEQPLAELATRDLTILPGYSPHVSPAYNDWLDDWRAHLHVLLIDEVVAGISRAKAGRDWRLMIDLARQALNLDPDNESAVVARATAAEQIARETHTGERAIARRNGWHRSAARLRESTPRARLSQPNASNTAARHTQDTPLVGRDLQMLRLRSNAMHTLDGGVTSTFISGTAGIGKSRLVREIVAWLRPRGAAICIAECERQDGHRPLSTFIRAVPMLQALPGAAGCAPDTVECLDRITRLTTGDWTPDADPDAMQLAATIRTAVIDLIDAIADEQPLVFVVEDVHWIDTASWSLLRTVAAKAQGSVLLICTSRSSWQHVSWGAPEYFHLEELPPLDAAATRTHTLDYLARAQRVADECYVTWCVETSNGNPYFVEELINYWVSTGDQYSAPPSLVALSEARLACIKPDALRLIQAAAILGKNSTVDLLRRMLEFPTHTIFTSVEELGDSGLLTVSGGTDLTGTAPVLCRHDLVRRAATRGLSAHGRALLHHAAARAMEAVATESRSAEILWDCADHWQAAGEVERSITAAIACARHLGEMGLVRDAIKRCELTLGMCPDEPARLRVLRAMAHAQYAARDWSDFCTTVAQVRSLEHSSILASPIHDDLELAELNAQRNIHRDWQGALEMTLRCIHSMSATVAHRVKATVIALKLATNTGELETMDTLYRDAALLATSSEVDLMDRLTLTMVYHAIRGDIATGANAARELLRLAHQTLPLRHQLSVMLDCAGAIRRCGLAEEAERIYAALFDAAVELQCFDFVEDACHRLIEMHCDAGDMVGAVEWMTRFRKLRRPRGNVRRQRNLRLAFARVHLWQGQWDAAAKLLEAPKKAPPWEDPVAMFRSGALAMKIRLDIGRGAGTATVVRWIDELEPLNARLRLTGTQDYESHSLYLAYRYIGRSDTADQFLRTYVESERRDSSQLSPEIAAVVDALKVRLATPSEAAGLLACAAETDATNT
jgi:hypothetical protein